MEEEGEATHLDPVQVRLVALPPRQLVSDYEFPVPEFKMDLGPPEASGQALRGAPSSLLLQCSQIPSYPQTGPPGS